MRILLFLVAILVGVSSKSFRQQCTAPTDYAYHISQSTAVQGNTNKIKAPKSDDGYEFKNNVYRTFGRMELAADVTIAFWANWYSFKKFSRIVDLGDGPTTNNYVIYNLSNTNNIAIWRKSSNGERYQMEIHNLLETYKFNHFTVVFHSSGEITVYINGVQYTGNTTKYGSASNAQQGSNNVKQKGYIGKSHWDNDEYFNGIIDELMVFNRVLSQEEINCLNDWCDNTCFSTCKKKSNNCDAAPAEHTDGNTSTCPVPSKPLYDFSNVDSLFTKVGSISTTTGPVSDKAQVFANEAWMKFKYSDVYGGEMSIVMWVRFDKLSGWTILHDFGNGADKENVMLANQSSTPTTIEYSIRLHKDHTKQNTVYQQNGIEVGKWHHYISTIDRKGNAKLYIDGKNVGTSTKGFDHAVEYIYRANSYLGKSNWNHNNIFHGAIDDFQVYGRVLKPEEILCLSKKCEVACANNQAWCAYSSKNCKTANCAEIYSDCNYRGTKQLICQNTPQLNPMEVRSIKVPTGYMVRLYSTVNYGAQIAEFKRDEQCLQSIPFKDNTNKVLLQKIENNQDEL